MRPLWIYIGVTGSLLLRLSVLDFESGDYRQFLSNWYDQFVERGRWNALADDFSSYPPLYLYCLSLSTFLPLPKLYAIKLISILADYVAAWFVYKLVRGRRPEGSMPCVAAIATLFLPTVWFNSAVWGQCDAMFTAALLGTVYYLIAERPLAGMVAFGLACSLKPQAIFLVPFLGGWFFRQGMPWRWVAVPPLVYGVCGLPSILAGKPILQVLSHWGRQQNYPVLTMGATNWYQWISNDYFGVFYNAGIVLTIVGTALLILTMQMPSLMDRPAWFVTTALVSVLMVPYFLPGMHERYFFAADLFALVYAFFVTRGWVVAVLVQFCSFFTYLPYLFEMEPLPRPLLAVVMTAALGIVACDLARAVVVQARITGPTK
ncbi:MAG: glycosyltransferase family 39 protein [Verrucomicrobia bacterium]|nr:glycosyltransferase family 39 protein [Verrucomicrobiota bacterium]